jgi:hypothetical protein
MPVLSERSKAKIFSLGSSADEECFDGLSMNGKSSGFQNGSVRPEHVEGLRTVSQAKRS